MPADETQTLCNWDVSEPADDSQETDGAGYMRQIKKAVDKWAKLQHGCDGKHLYGAASGTADVIVVEVGIASQLAIVGLHAGLFVKFKVGTTNTGATTLQITVNSVNVGSATAVKFAGAALAAGVLVAGQIVEVVYDGTDWQLLSGFALSPVVLPVLPGGLLRLIIPGATSSEQNNTAAEIQLVSHTLAVNTYTRVLVEYDFYLRNETGTNRTIEFKLYVGGVLTRTWEVLSMRSLTSGGRVLQHLAANFPGGQVIPTAIAINGQMSVADADVGVQLADERIFGYNT